MMMNRLVVGAVWVGIGVWATVVSGNESEAGGAGGGDTAVTTGRVNDVTVYRGQALVTRIIDLKGPAGLREVVITDLPLHVLPESIYAEAEAGVEVRSVRYRVRPIEEDVREEVRTIDAKLVNLRRSTELVVRRQALLAERKAYLDKLEMFVAPTATAELSKGVLNAETLKSLTLFSFDQRSALADEEMDLVQEQRNLSKQMDLLERERAVLSGTSSRTVREAVVFVSIGDEEGGRLRLRYLVNNASWSPSYNVRTDGNRERMEVEYHASIQQMSGEDWNNVDMTLSTATPSLVAKAPVLTELKVRLASFADAAVNQTSPGTGFQLNLDYKQSRKKLKQRQAQVGSERGRAAGRADKDGRATIGGYLATKWDNEQFDNRLNAIASDMQLLDLAAVGAIRRELQRPSAPRAQTEGVSVTYHVAARTSLPSRSDRQLIRIASLQLPAEFYKLAIPVLTNYVYDEAAAVNDSAVVLLPGPVAAYANGQFVGHGTLPLVAVGEVFTVGFGIDPSLRVGRELIEKKDQLQGGNREVEFTYRLSIENFANAAADVRLLDRLPVAGTKQIQLTQVSTGLDLSDDPTYRKTVHKQGILRWDVEVPPNAVGPDSFALEHTFRMEYDKQMTITGLAMAD